MVSRQAEQPAVPVSRQALLDSLPPAWPADLLPQIRLWVAAEGQTVVVLDDDPTGTQTVHGVPVLTGWSVEALAAELMGDPRCFYLLTNSRSLPPAEAAALNREIGGNLAEAARRSGRDFVVVSRSDSTLRGHFPGEVQALAEALPGEFDAWLLVPFFEEGGRLTAGDIHYVAEGEMLLPAGQTPYARDEAFGYTASDLRHWVEEKSNGRWAAAEVVSLGLEEIRQGPERVTERLLSIPRGGVGVVNAVSYRDLELFVLGLLGAESRGKRYLYRTAASFVRVRAGLAPRPLLQATELGLKGQAGGLMVVGSYVPKTTKQVQALCEAADVCRLEINVRCLLDEGEQAAEIERVAAAANASLQAGRDTVLVTTRQLVRGGDAEAGLAIGRRVGDGLIAILRRLTTRPRYLVAKGGITSSDIATRALSVQRALVLGQILPGVPVWQLGQESAYPGLPYIVFPGNVGDDEALAQIAAILEGSEEVAYAGSHR